MKMIQGNFEDAKLLAMEIRRKYSKEYRVTISCDVDAYVLHIRSDETGMWGAIKGVGGVDKDIVVRIRPDGNVIFVEASGNYRGKLGRIGFGTFVAVGAVAVTAAWGSVLQADMALAIESFAEEFLQKRKRTALPYRRVIAA